MCLQDSVRQKLIDSRNRILDLYNQNIIDNTSFNDNCDYLTTDDCKTIVIRNCDLSVLQLNIRGLLNKQNELRVTKTLYLSRKYRCCTIG